MNVGERLAEREAEVRVLREQLAVANAELAGLRALLAQVQEQTVAANRRGDELLAQVAKANDRIEELLAVVTRKKAARKPAKPPEPVAPPNVGEEARRTFEDRPRPPEPAGPFVDHPKPKQRPTGRKRLPETLPTDETTLWPERCDCGCQDFEWVDEVVEEKLQISAHVRRKVTHRKTGRCVKCRMRTTAEAPPSPFPRSRLTCDGLAWLVTQKFAQIVPLERIKHYLGVRGVALATSFYVTQMEHAADILAPIDGHQWKTLLAGGGIETDGTGFKVQIRGADGLHHGHLEVYHRGETVVFQYEPEKGGETQAAKLKTFAGWLLVDGESRYNETTRSNPRVVEANCNAHPRRKLEEAEATQPALAAEAGRFVSEMFDHEAKAKELGLEGGALRLWRQERIRPLFDELKAWMEAVEPTLAKPDELAKVIRYYRNHWTELARFLDDPTIPIDNSASEREFQWVAKLRLNSFFAGGTEGARRAAILLGVAATCRRLRVDMEAYLTWVFVRRGTHRDKYAYLTAANLTPQAYKSAMLADARPT
jgi:transposase